MKPHITRTPKANKQAGRQANYKTNKRKRKVKLYTYILYMRSKTLNFNNNKMIKEYARKNPTDSIIALNALDQF